MSYQILEFRKNSYDTIWKLIKSTNHTQTKQIKLNKKYSLSLFVDILVNNRVFCELMLENVGSIIESENSIHEAL